MKQASIHGLTYSPELSNHDHVFATFLRQHKAVDNFHTTANATMWRDPTGEVVAVAFYDNATCNYSVWIKV